MLHRKDTLSHFLVKHESSNMAIPRILFSATALLAGLASTTSLAVGDNGWSPIFSRLDSSEASWPFGPFCTKGRDIVNARNEAVTWAGVNWPGSGETMIPEGLEWSSVDDILDLVKSVGFNFIRLTYAIEAVDQIYERDGQDVPIEVALISGLGYANGTKVTNEMIAKNAGWTKDTKRFEIWDTIAQKAAEREIYIHPVRLD